MSFHEIGTEKPFDSLRTIAEHFGINEARRTAGMDTPPEIPEPIHARAITNEERACSFVRQTVLEKLDKTDSIPEFDVYVVWYCYILGNWKALVSTSLPDGKYYEVTFDRAKNSIYVDSYVKFDNQSHPQPYEV